MTPGLLQGTAGQEPVQLMFGIPHEQQRRTWKESAFFEDWGKQKALSAPDAPADSWINVNTPSHHLSSSHHLLIILDVASLLWKSVQSGSHTHTHKIKLNAQPEKVSISQTNSKTWQENNGFSQSLEGTRWALWGVTSTTWVQKPPTPTTSLLLFEPKAELSSNDLSERADLNGIKEQMLGLSEPLANWAKRHLKWSLLIL